MSSWFYIALSAPALWAASNLIDKHLLESHFKDRSISSFYLFGGALSVLIVLLIGILRPGVMDIPPSHALILLGGSILGSGMLFCYFKAMRLADPSVVISLFQLIPVFYLFLGYIIFGDILNNSQLLGSSVIILAALALSLDFSEEKIHIRASMLGWMLLACLFSASNGLAFKYVGLQSGYLSAVFWDDMGIVIVSFVLFCVATKARRELFEIFRENKGILSLLVVNELLTTSGNFLIYYAGLLAPLALVQVVNGFQPVFILLYSAVIAVLLPGLSQENLTKRHIFQKALAIAVILVGTLLINR